MYELLYLHSMGGCDATIPKILYVLTALRSTHDFAQNGENFFLKLYGRGNVKTLDYVQEERKEDIIIYSFHWKHYPTGAAAKYQSNWAYHPVQQCISHAVSPLDLRCRVSYSFQVQTEIDWLPLTGFYPISFFFAIWDVTNHVAVVRTSCIAQLCEVGVKG